MSGDLTVRRTSPPLFAAENLAARTHGMTSPRVYRPEAEEALSALLAVVEEEGIEFPTRPSFFFAVEALADTIGQVRVGRKHLAEDHATGKCDRETCAHTLDRFEGRLDRRLDAMGLTPASRARIEQALSSSARNQVDTVAALEVARKARMAAEEAERVADSSGDPL
jgi:hypothetical protein